MYFAFNNTLSFPQSLKGFLVCRDYAKHKQQLFFHMHTLSSFIILEHYYFEDYFSKHTMLSYFWQHDRLLPSYVHSTYLNYVEHSTWNSIAYLAIVIDFCTFKQAREIMKIIWHPCLNKTITWMGGCKATTISSMKN